MTRDRYSTTTTQPLSHWSVERGQQAQASDSSADTRASSGGDFLFLRGKLVEGQGGEKELVVSMNPAEVERKLAIRQANTQPRGSALDTNTGAFGNRR